MASKAEPADHAVRAEFVKFAERRSDQRERLGAYDVSCCLALHAIRVKGRALVKRSHVFGGRLFRSLAEKLGEAADMIRVGVNGRLSKVAQLHIIGHAFREHSCARLPGRHGGHFLSEGRVTA